MSWRNVFIDINAVYTILESPLMIVIQFSQQTASSKLHKTVCRGGQLASEGVWQLTNTKQLVTSHPLSFITSTKEVMLFTHICLILLVGVSAGLNKNYRTHFHEI